MARKTEKGGKFRNVKSRTRNMAKKLKKTEKEKNTKKKNKKEEKNKTHEK